MQDIALSNNLRVWEEEHVKETEKKCAEWPRENQEALESPVLREMCYGTERAEPTISNVAKGSNKMVPES